MLVSDNNIMQLLCQAEKRLSVNSTTWDGGRRTVPVCASATTASPSKQQQLTVRDPQSKTRKPSKKGTAGSNWFDLPETNLTSDFKRDWALLRMRGLLDPKHHKKSLRAAPPKFSHVGQVISGATDRYSARLDRKQRKKTIFDEVMSTTDDAKLKSKYAGIQRSKSSGKKAFYKNLVLERRRR
ncbi:hypothetical protein CDD81_4804 [Ophiocordyceps australis]|uniref:Fcf2 pre-rRNA processing C-terminal domain-containing protein n=1 Tax=Ophiocordyceps australis TaxID=1399860 RepID=A0A2C5XTD8_9HYPO|nr:hypothetical protein CDD81_4804 [Ophiocordyceps australis]